MHFISINCSIKNIASLRCETKKENRYQLETAACSGSCCLIKQEARALSLVHTAMRPYRLVLEQGALLNVIHRGFHSTSRGRLSGSAILWHKHFQRRRFVVNQNLISQLQIVSQV
jgi:hypothetical protein